MIKAKNFENDTWEIFNNEIIEKQLVLFGTSSGCEHFFQDEEKKYIYEKVKMVVDNSKDKIGKLFLNKYIIQNPKELCRLDKDNIVILITSVYFKEISEQLESMGIHNYFSLVFLKAIKEFSDINYKVDDDKIEELKCILNDQKSIDIVENIVNKRRNRCVNYSDIKENNQYFQDEIFSKQDDEVFIDAGSYIGDTVEEFIKWTNNKYKKVYAYELDNEIFNILSNKGFDKRVTCVNAGVSDKYEEFEYTYGAYQDRKEMEASLSRCVAIDEDVKEKVSFIKMDIEGFEIKALNGAKNIILRDKPKLAICIYHKQEDLWEIPNLIHDMVPEYKLYIRHHSNLFIETVLYATL